MRSGCCMVCDAPLTVGPSCFPGFDLLHCSECERSVKLIVRGGRSPRPVKMTRAAQNRMLRAARRRGVIA